MAGADREFIVAILLLRPDPRQREAKAARVVAPAADRCEFGIIFVRQLGPLHRARPRELEPRRLVERPHCADVDRGADRGAVDAGLRRLVDVGAEITSDGSTSNENSRPLLSVARVRPLTVTALNFGPKPRTVTKRPSPRLRSIVTPAMR